jgi:hypothetical protein
VFVIGLSDIVRAVHFVAATKVCVRCELPSRRFASDALARVPNSEVVFVTVDEVRAASRLALAQVLDSAEHISRNGPHVLHLLLHDGSLGERILDSLVVDSLLYAIEEALLSKTETVRLGATLNRRICLPVILTASLLTWVVVAVSALIHLSVVILLVQSAASWVQDFLCVNDVFGWQAESRSSFFGGCWPYVAAGHTLAQGFALVSVVARLHRVIEFVSEASQVLRSDHLINVVAEQHWLSVGEVLADWLFVLYFAWVHKNLAWVDVGEFAVLQDVARGAIVALFLSGEAVDADAVIRVVPVRRNEFAGSADALNRVRLALHNRRGRSKCVNHLSNLLNDI